MSAVLISWLGISPGREEVREFVASKYGGTFEMSQIVRRPHGIEFCQIYGLGDKAPEVVRAIHGQSLDGKRVTAKVWSFTYFLPNPSTESVIQNGVLSG